MSSETITVPAGAFGAAVAWAAKWKANRPAIPVHAGLLIETPGSPGGLRIHAFNGEVAATAVVAVEGKCPPGRAIVSGNLLAALTATLGSKGTVALSMDDKHLTLKAGRWSGALPTLPTGDWPDMPQAPEVFGTVNGDALAAVVARVGVACSDSANPASLMLMHLELDPGGGLNITATDRYRVAEALVLLGEQDEPERPDLVVATPYGSVLREAAASFAGPAAVALGFDRWRMVLRSDTRQIVMPLGDPGADGWPVAPMRKALDAAPSYAGHATLRTADILAPLKRAAIVRGKEGPVRLSLTPGLLVIASSEAQLDQEGNEEIEIKYDGPAGNLAFNPDYFASALASAPGPEVGLHFIPDENYTTRPVVLTCDDDPSWRHALMPLVIR